MTSVGKRQGWTRTILLLAVGLALVVWLWSQADAPDTSDPGALDDAAEATRRGPMLEASASDAAPTAARPSRKSVKVDKDAYAHRIREQVVFVRDLHDGSPLPGFDLLLAQVPEGPPTKTPTPAFLLQDLARELAALHRSRLATDDEGRTHVRWQGPRAAREMLVPASEGWFATNPQRVFDSNVLWVVRLSRVRVHVVSEQGSLDPKTVRTGIRFLDRRDVQRYAPSGVTALDRTRVHQLRRTLDHFAFTARHEHVVPGCRGFLVTAHADGFQGAAQHVDPRAHRDGAAIRLVLHPAPRLRGRVLCPDGKPIPNAKVLIRVVVPYPRDPLEADRLMSGMPWGCTGAGGKQAPEARFELTVRPHAQKGTFGVYLPLEGHVHLRASAPGHVDRVLELGPIDEHHEADTIELTPERGERRLHAPVTFRRLDGKTVDVKGTLTLMEIEGTAVTRTFKVEVSKDGLMEIGELRRDLRYALEIGDAWLGQFDWEEQDAITVTLVPAQGR